MSRHTRADECPSTYSVMQMVSLTTASREAL